MAFWCFMLLCDLLIPLTMILAGAVMCRRSPRRINRFFGYRTRRSMQNPDTWMFAQAYYGDRPHVREIRAAVPENGLACRCCDRLCAAAVFA